MARHLRTAALAAVLLLAVVSAGAASAPCKENKEGDGEALCQRCAPDGSKCLECLPSNGLSSSGECVPCNVTTANGNRCSQCDGDDPSFCTECVPSYGMGGASGYYATAEGECAQCPDTYCKNCSSLTGACLSCNRFWGAVNGTCFPCAQKECLECDGDLNKCKLCGYGLFTDPVSGRCLNCTDPHCGDCSSAVDKCGSCQSGYTLDKQSGRCVACAEGCISCDTAGPGRCDKDGCDSGWGHVDANSTCVRCSGNCTACASGSKCATCATGFGLLNDECRSCGNACNECTFDSAGKPQCTSCGYGGLDLATKTCVLCKPDFCNACMDDARICTGCMEGFRTTMAGTCVACSVPYCSRCDDDAAKCDLPNDGYRVTANGTTEACTVEHCASCFEAADQCESCLPGYNLDPKTNTCYACPESCDSCTNKYSCMACASGYWRLSGTGLCQKCEPGDTTHPECGSE